MNECIYIYISVYKIFFAMRIGSFPFPQYIATLLGDIAFPSQHSTCVYSAFHVKDSGL